MYKQKQLSQSTYHRPETERPKRGILFGVDRRGVQGLSGVDQPFADTCLVKFQKIKLNYL